MELPNRDNRTWPFRWFSIHAMGFLIALAIIIAATYPNDLWFFGLTLWLAISVGWLAWRNANALVTRRWWLGLCLVIAVTWGYTSLLVLAGPGDTNVCYDRVHSDGRYWTPLRNLGPDPKCDGVPLQDVDVSVLMGEEGDIEYRPTVGNEVLKGRSVEILKDG